MFAILGLVWLFIGVNAESAFTRIFHHPHKAAPPESIGQRLSTVPPYKMRHKDTANYSPFSFYAAVAYCKPEILENWSGRQSRVPSVDDSKLNLFCCVFFQQTAWSILNSQS